MISHPKVTSPFLANIQHLPRLMDLFFLHNIIQLHGCVPSSMDVYIKNLAWASTILPSWKET